MSKNSIVLLLCLVPILASCGEQKQGEQKPVLLKEQKLVLKEEQKQFKAHKRSLPESDPLYSLLEVVEDGYKFVQVSEVRPNEPRQGLTPAPPRGQVEWGWKFTGRNKTDADTFITVKYMLLDQDSFELASDTENRSIKGGETMTIQNTSVLPYEDALKVARSAWKVSTGKTAAHQSQVGGSKGRREEGMIRSVEIPTPQQEFWKQTEEARKLQEEQRQLLAESARQLTESQNPQGVALAQNQAEESGRQQEQLRKAQEEAITDAEKQRKAYWDSVEESKRQQEVSRRLQEKVDEQNRRFDQILTTWEEQQKQYQRYLDKLEQK